MKEKDILYENGNFWVVKYKNLFHVMKNTNTHAIGEEVAYEDFSVACARCDYLAKIQGLSTSYKVKWM